MVLNCSCDDLLSQDYCRRIYDFYGESEKVKILGPEGPHAYLPVFQEAAVDWFRTWL